MFCSSFVFQAESFGFWDESKVLLIHFSSDYLQEGVGDTADSYAYDGHRVRKWNLSASAYGEVCDGQWTESIFK